MANSAESGSDSDFTLDKSFLSGIMLLAGCRFHSSDPGSRTALRRIANISSATGVFSRCASGGAANPCIGASPAEIRSVRPRTYEINEPGKIKLYDLTIGATLHNFALSAGWSIPFGPRVYHSLFCSTIEGPLPALLPRFARQLDDKANYVMSAGFRQAA